MDKIKQIIREEINFHKYICSTKGSCMKSSENLSKDLLEQGIDHSVIEGYVVFENGKSPKFQHTWIEVGNRKIDPTLVQFNG